LKADEDDPNHNRAKHSSNHKVQLDLLQGMEKQDDHYQRVNNYQRANDKSVEHRFRSSKAFEMMSSNRAKQRIVDEKRKPTDGR